jgi:type IV pilus assembly protein PilM
MNILNIFKAKENFVGVDIGTNSVKLVYATKVGDSFKVESVKAEVAPQSFFSQNVISKPNLVAETLRKLSSNLEIKNPVFTTAVPITAVLPKKLKVPNMDLEDLREHIEFEASNFIPQGADSVYLDYHVLEATGKNQLEVLVIAVKKEVVESYVECFSQAGLKLSVIDIDQFAIQNCFELNYPELVKDTNVLVNIGSKCTGVTICKEGQALFVGDIPIGGKTLSDAICEITGCKPHQVDEFKRRYNEDVVPEIEECVQTYISSFAKELSKQISYFWNASGAKGGIDRIVIAGGASCLRGLSEAITEETATECHSLEPLKNFSSSEDFQIDSESQSIVAFASCIGLSTRATGDKVWIDY